MHPDWKARSKIIFFAFADDMVLYIENLKESIPRKLHRDNKWLQQGCGVQGQHMQLCVFLYTSND